MPLDPPAAVSPWPHRSAVLLACAVFPLLLVGGLVTTADAGMAVPDWPTTYGYNLFLYPWQTWLFGPWDLFVEHGHRLLGAGVGLLTIGLVIVLQRCEPRAWVRRLGWMALALVILQGVLGGMRVRMNDRDLAMWHACTGPLFFAVAASLAVVTSRTWRTGSDAQTKGNAGGGAFSADRLASLSRAARLRPLAVVTCGLVYAQIVLGAQLRHIPESADPGAFAAAVKFHLLLAAVLLGHVAALAWTAFRRCRRWTVLRNLALVLGLLMLIQLALGAGTWALKYSVAQWAAAESSLSWYTIHAGGILQTSVVTAHMAVGSLLLAVSLALAVYGLRLIPSAAGQRNNIIRLAGTVA